MGVNMFQPSHIGSAGRGGPYASNSVTMRQLERFQRMRQDWGPRHGFVNFLSCLVSDGLALKIRRILKAMENAGFQTAFTTNT